MKKILLILLLFTINNSCTPARHPKGYWINISTEKLDNHLSKKTTDLSTHLIRIKGNKYKIFRLNERNSISRFMAKKIYEKLRYFNNDSIVIQDNNYLKIYRRLNDSLKVKSSEKIVLKNRKFTLRESNKIDTLKFLKNSKLEYIELGEKHLTQYKRIREKGFDIVLIEKPLKTFVIRNELIDRLELTTISKVNKNVELKKVQ